MIGLRRAVGMGGGWGVGGVLVYHSLPFFVLGAVFRGSHYSDRDCFFCMGAVS